jgi:hypothetical protein
MQEDSELDSNMRIAMPSCKDSKKAKSLMIVDMVVGVEDFEIFKRCHYSCNKIISE